MRKIILNVAVSLDGFIEGPNGEYDWCFTDQDYGLADFFDSTDAIFIGRKSYELIAGEEHAFPGKKIYLFSDSVKTVDNPEVHIIPSANFEQEVKAILEKPGQDIYLFGGAKLVSALINKNLITEMLLSVHPVLLGGGKPLFTDLAERTNLQFISQQTYDSGLVQVRYALKPKFDMEMLKML